MVFPKQFDLNEISENYRSYGPAPENINNVGKKKLCLKTCAYHVVDYALGTGF